jgi:hypothetical protein
MTMKWTDLDQKYLRNADMIRRISEKSIQNLLKSFLDYEELRIQAVRRLDVPEANKYILKAAAAAKLLSGTLEGRAEIENLLRHAKLYVRVRAAEVVMDWAADKAIPVFGAMLDADLSSISSVDERLDIRVIAKDWLFKHFNIRGANRNDLIEPLRAYGIELKNRDEARWQ